VLETNAAPPQLILKLAYGFWHAKALFAAVELDVFTILAAGPMDLETLMAATPIHQRGARDFLDSLVALRLLERDEKGRYSNSSESDLYLVRGRPTYIGGLLRHLDARHYKNWKSLTRALVTGEPQTSLGSGSYTDFYADQLTQQLFLQGMTAGSLPAVRTLARTFPWHRYKTFADIGTAQGCAPVEIALMHPHLRGGGFDLPFLEKEFAAYVRRHSLSERLTFYPGDFFSDPLPSADVLVMGRVLHNWADSVRAMLLEKAYQAISPGGALIVYDPMIDEERRSEPHALLSSLNMLIETAAGSEYTAAECADWMSRAEFREIKIEPLQDVHTAVIGFKLPAPAL